MFFVSEDAPGFFSLTIGTAIKIVLFNVIILGLIFIGSKVFPVTFMGSAINVLCYFFGILTAIYLIYGFITGKVFRFFWQTSAGRMDMGNSYNRVWFFRLVTLVTICIVLFYTKSKWAEIPDVMEIMKKFFDIK